jgi:hypothetical protein
MASYSTGRDIGAESETTGTKLDIAANDHIRPIATTTAIIHANICIPSRRVELADRRFPYFCAALCEVVHRYPK